MNLIFFLIVVFVVAGGILLTAISKSARSSKGNSYGSGYYRAGSSTFVDPNTPGMTDSFIDSNPAVVGAAVDLGYIQADAGNMKQPGVDSGAMAQQSTDSGALGSSGADISAASSAGWDAGSAAGSSIAIDMSSSTFTGSMDSGMSGGMDSGSSGM